MSQARCFLVSHGRSLALLTAMAAGGVGGAASAQSWTVVNMHPSWAVNSELRAVDGGSQVGLVNNLGIAMKWTGASTATVVLNPVRENAAQATGVSGGRQCGSVSLDFGVASHAALWSGSPGSFVDLHPLDTSITHSNVLGMDGMAQVGSYFAGGGGTFSTGRACMWTGTAASFVDLQPLAFATGEARGVLGNQQVGATFDSFLGSACMWSGSAESFVDLTPADSIASVAQCTDGVHQYGTAAVLSPIPGIFPARWSGTAESWESMGVPEGLYGEIMATSGGYQVGQTYDMNSENYRAVLWRGVGDFEDLHQYVPAAYSQSRASGVWRHAASGTTYVAGLGINATTGQTEAMMWVQSSGVNLIVSPGSPDSCIARPGEPMAYTVRVLNAGPIASGPVMLTVDLPAMSAAVYTTASPAPSSASPTQLVFSLPSLAASGGATDIAITLTAAGAGQTAAITATAMTPGEVDPTNNTASASARVAPASSTGVATALMTTATALANSASPAGGHYRALSRPVASPSGNWWIIRATTDLAASQDLMYLRVPVSGSPQIVAREGVTTTSNGVVTDLYVGAEVNDSGRVAFGGVDNGPSASRTFIASWDGAALVDIARTGRPISGIPGVNYGGLGGSINLFANGQTGFYATSSPAGSNAYLSANGSTVVARANVTQPAGSPAVIQTLLSNTAGTGALAFDPSGSHAIYQANIVSEDTGLDQVIVVDGTVLMQENTTVLPGFFSPVDGNNKPLSMGPGGVWTVRGANGIATETWVATGSGTDFLRVVRGGDEIVPGAGEHWAAVYTSGVVTTTFFAAATDGAGRLLVGGFTDSDDTFTDSVLVYDGSTVVARENDPIDLNGDGQFNDDAYIRSFDADAVAFVDGAVLVTVSYRDGASAVCRLNNASRGQAVLRIPITPACPADFNGDGFLDFFDYDDYVNCFESGVCPPGRSADFNGDEFVDFFDYDDFVTAFEHGC